MLRMLRQVTYVQNLSDMGSVFLLVHSGCGAMQGSRDRHAVRGRRGIQGAAAPRIGRPPTALKTHQEASRWHRCCSLPHTPLS